MAVEHACRASLALEGLAWDRTLLPQVSMILAALDEMTPRVNSGNSASRSLLEIFMPWLPQTTAPIEERVKVLQMLVRGRPEAGWRLLVGLLPNQQAFSTPTYRPLWRDWCSPGAAAFRPPHIGNRSSPVAICLSNS